MALQIEASILERVSEQAIRDRRPDLIDADALDGCKKTLLEVSKLSWKRGVGPATRLDLDFELARITLLEGKYDECLAHADQLTSARQRYGYRLWSPMRFLLRCEALWAKRQFDEAERLFHQLLEIERETGYKAHHPTRVLIQHGIQPSRCLVV